MLSYKRKILSNGLIAIAQKDDSTPLVAINILYKVGSRDEEVDKTGFTHLFEHLMFGGTKNIANYDDVIQQAGGENNAFTNTDFTNFHITLPLENIERGLWLESDRMRGLHFTKRKLDIQKKVVIEEFKETTLNEPYGDMMHHISDLVYTKNSYKWPTIGKEISHIQNASFEDVRSFYDNYYKPNNAIISIVGNIAEEQSFELIEKWFGDIPTGNVKTSTIIYDESHSGFRTKTVHANVPLKAIVMAFMMSDRISRDFYIADLISDILSSGRSSRLYQDLVKEKQLFAQIDCYLSGSSDPGMFIVEGKLNETANVEIGKNAIIEALSKIYLEKIDNRELQKIKNKAETHLVFSELGILNKAMTLASFEHLGDIDLINRETDIYQSISGEEIAKVAQHLFAEENCSLLIYEQLMTE